MARNIIAPFKFVRHIVSFVFAIKYNHQNLEDYIAQIGQLQRAATLPPVEQNDMIAAIVFSRQNRLTFDTCWLESVQENILLKVRWRSLAKKHLF